MIVTLSPPDMMLASMAGVMRNVENMKKGRRGAHKWAKSKMGDFQANIIGCMGELVVSRMMGLPWHGKGEFRGPDVGENIEVRTGEQSATFHLILHDDDPSDRLFFPVRRIPGTAKFEVYAPILGAAGKRVEHWVESDRPCYMVPVETLSLDEAAALKLAQLNTGAMLHADFN